MAYVIKITDLTGEGKPDLYYAEPKDMRRALVADINQAKKYATEEEAYDEIDDSDVAELVVDYGYYAWESDVNGNVDDVDKVPGDAIDIITESKSLKDIRNRMNKLVENASINMIESNTVKAYVVYLEIRNEVYYIYSDDDNYTFGKTPNILGASFFETEEDAQRAFFMIASELDLTDDEGTVLDNMLKTKEVTITY